MKRTFFNLSIGLLSGFLLGIFWFFKNPYFTHDNQKMLESLLLKNTPPSIFSAWIPWWENQRPLTSIQRAGSRLSLILPVWYNLEPSGNIKKISTDNIISITNEATFSGKMIMPSIGNDFDAQRVTKLLTDSDLQTAEIDHLTKEAVNNNYYGWDLDWEQIAIKDKNLFSQFVALLSQKLHQQGLKLSVTVHAQTGQPTDWEGALGQDWPVLAKEADYIRIMAYDFHHDQSDPGPVTPLDILEQVLKYAQQTIPQDKIVLGVPTYGYDWGADMGESLQYENAIGRLNNLGVKWQRDSQSFALTAQYTVGQEKHIVWFEDNISLKKKVEIAREFGIYQFCLWSLGGEDLAIWTAD